MKWGRYFALRLVAVGIGLAGTLLAAEIALRFLPYNEGLIVPAVNDSQPIYRFVPNREFRYSQGWDMKNGRVRRTNNAGFLSDIDYVATPERPLLAVIGDSFIEAVHVDWDKSIHGRLHERLASAIDVYAFGAASASLGQYLAWADYVRISFSPGMMVVNIVGNDYDLIREGAERGFKAGFRGMAYLVERANGSVELERTDRPAESWWRGLLRHSALVAYLYRNLQVIALPERLRAQWQARLATDDAVPFVANTVAAIDPERLARAKRHVDRFLDLLPVKADLPPENIVITLDGLRTQLYDPDELAAIQDSFPAVMNRYTVAAGRGRGYEVLDLTSAMIGHHRATGERFEFPFNGHWNATGHEIMAQAVLTSKTLARVFPDGAPRPNQ